MTDVANDSSGERGRLPPPLEEKEEEEDDDAAALEMMMAFQQQQEEEEFAAGSGSGAEGAANTDGVAGGAVLLPVEAGDVDGANDDDDNGGPDLVALGLPNAADADNPAAVALANRRAQNLLRQRRQAERIAGRGFLARIFFPRLHYARLSLLAAFLLVHHTLRTRQQVYLALVYLQSSKLAYIVLGNAVIASATALFSLITDAFLDGGLRANEREAIGEQIRWNLTETCLALTIFRTELDVATAIMFLILVLAKCLHWSVELRGGHLRMTEEVFVYSEAHDDDDGDPDREADGNSDGNDDTARPPRAKRGRWWYHRLPRPRFTHIRFYTLANILFVLDIAAAAYCAVAVADRGPSVHILFGFEAAILLSSALSCLGSYHLHVIDGCIGALCHWVEGEHHYHPVGGLAPEGVDQSRGNAAEEQPRREPSLARRLMERIADPWRDRRATLGFAVELQSQAAKFLFYLVFFAIVFTYYGMPINIFREVYVSYQQLRQRLAAFNKYRRLTHNMDKRFESVSTPEELEAVGKICIICRDVMAVGGAKKLGCGHAFHAHCLREWLVQQQTCPTCRGDILANEARTKVARAREAERTRVEEETERTRVEEEAARPLLDGEQGGEPEAAALGEPQTQPRVGETEETGGAAAGNVVTAAGGNPPATVANDDDKRGMPSGMATTAITDQRTPPPVAASASGLAHRRSSRSPPLAIVARTAPTAMAASSPPPSGLSAVSSSVGAGFPCLYRITSPVGAPVLSAAQPHIPIRFVPRGKLIVCTSVEYLWMTVSSDPGEIFYRVPDGFVRERDVKRFLPLPVAAA